MRAYLLAAVGCIILAGCANPVDRVVESVGTATMASVKYPLKLADWSVQRAQEQRQNQ